MKRTIDDDANMEGDWTKAWALAYAAESEKNEEVEADADLYDDVCPICHVIPVSDSSGLRLVCPTCGLVVENFTDDKPEWNTAQDKHTGASDTGRGDAINPLMPHASMNTDIVPTGRIRYDQYKMMKLNRWSAMSPVERSLCAVYTKIESACSRHKVPGPVQYTTKSLFQRVYNINLQKHEHGDKREGLRGGKRDGLIAACNYMAFKIHDLYWKKDVVANVYEISSTEIRRGISIFWDLVKGCELTENLAKITGCKQYIKWFSVELKLPRTFANYATELFRSLKQFGIGASKQPQSVAAWCIWAVCQALKPDMTITKLSEVTEISKATIIDVERFSAGIEKSALAGVFANDICNLCEIYNTLTVLKIVNTAKALCRTKLIDTFAIWHLAGFAIYFVLTINNVTFNERFILEKCKLQPSVLLHIAQQVIPYRDAIICDYIGGVHRGGPGDGFVVSKDELFDESWGEDHVVI